MFDIANIPFEHISDSEKQKYRAAIKEDGSFQGYKPKQYFVSEVLPCIGGCSVFNRSGPHSILTMEFATNSSTTAVSCIALSLLDFVLIDVKSIGM
jgi:hypothetical protein